MRLPRRRGFTLLEVMIAIGILAIALMSIGDLNGGAWRMHAYAKRLTLGVQLARGKMLDIQAQLRKDGVGDFSKSYHGDFDKEGAPDYKWTAEVVKAELDVTPEQLMSAVSGAMGLPKDSDSKKAQDPAASPLAALGPAAGMVDGLLKQSVETLKQSVREVRLHIHWKNGNEDEEFTVVEHVVILPNAAQAAAAAAAPMQQTTNGAAGGAGAAPGSINGGLNPMVPAGGIPGLPGSPGAFGATAPGGLRMTAPGGGFK